MLSSVALLTKQQQKLFRTSNTCSISIMGSEPWTPGQHDDDARQRLHIWPLDEHNAALLNEVHPRNYQQNKMHEIYDLVAIGSGAGGLVTSKQSALRGARSAMISEKLAGGDCLNVGCVPSKALLRSAKAIQQIQRAEEFGVVLPEGEVKVDFGKVMERLRRLRTKIAPADGHEGTEKAGAHVFQGRGIFTGPNSIQVTTAGERTFELQFRKAVIATGGRPTLPSIPGLEEAPYTTNETLFNLETLPPRMTVLGAGAVSLEMAQAFALLGSKVTVVQRTKSLLQSKQVDSEAARVIEKELEQCGVAFLTGSVQIISTIRERNSSKPKELPLLKVTVEQSSGSLMGLECECLLVATGRRANVENLGLDTAGIDFKESDGVLVNDLAQTSNPNVYAVGDCVSGVPRLTHMSGEMAKLVVQNSLFNDNWKLSSLVVPSVMYTEPELAIVGIYSEEKATKDGIEVDTYRAGLEHNDRGILESANVGFCKIVCKKGSDQIVGATIVAERAGEMINEVTLAIKNNVGLRAVGRNIHAYPTTGEAVMGAGIGYINSNWERLS